MTPKKNPQEGTHSVRTILPVRRSLIDAVLGPPQPLKRKPPRPPSSGAGVTRGAPNRKHPDEVILEIRRMREFEGAKVATIVDALEAKGHIVTGSYVESCIRYANAGSLVPNEKHGPYI